MAFGQNLSHLFVRSVRILLVLKFKMRGGTVTLGDNKAETLGSRLYLIDFGHQLLSVGLTAIPIAQGKAAGVAVAAIGRVGKESCEPIPVFPRIAVYAAAVTRFLPARPSFCGPLI